MALRLRLARGGAKKRPFYRIVVCDKRSPRDGRFIEKLGYYNPLLPKEDSRRLFLDRKRIQHWLGHGATPSDRVNRFLDQENLLPREARNNPQKAKPSKKTLERIAKAQEQKEKLREERQEEQRKAREEQKNQKEFTKKQQEETKFSKDKEDKHEESQVEAHSQNKTSSEETTTKIPLQD